MTDIVERLRSAFPGGEYLLAVMETQELKKEAADEIVSLRQRVAKLEEALEQTHDAWVAECEVVATLKSGQDSSIEHCLTCDNRGRVNGASQETFCEQCIYQRTWRKDHYKPAAPKPEE